MAEPKILIVYASRTGNTEKLAQAVAEGARSAGGVSVELKRAREMGKKLAEAAKKKAK